MIGLNMPTVQARRPPLDPDVMKRIIDRARGMVGRRQGPGQGNGSSPGYGPAGMPRGNNWGGFRGSNPTNLVSNNMRLNNSVASLGVPLWLAQYQQQLGRSAPIPNIDIQRPAPQAGPPVPMVGLNQGQLYR